MIGNRHIFYFHHFMILMKKKRFHIIFDFIINIQQQQHGLVLNIK